ncbi:MAG: GNAT family N-acetyltransferase [Alphaproteobacteria bacterium]
MATPIPASRSEQIRMHAFGPSPMIEILVAEDQGKLLAHSITYRGYDLRAGQPNLVVAALYVAPEGRRKGLARTMMSAIARRGARARMPAHPHHHRPAKRRRPQVLLGDRRQGAADCVVHAGRQTRSNGWRLKTSKLYASRSFAGARDTSFPAIESSRRRSCGRPATPRPPRCRAILHPVAILRHDQPIKRPDVIVVLVLWRAAAKRGQSSLSTRPDCGGQSATFSVQGHERSGFAELQDELIGVITNARIEHFLGVIVGRIFQHVAFADEFEACRPRLASSRHSD